LNQPSDSLKAQRAYHNSEIKEIIRRVFIAAKGQLCG